MKHLLITIAAVVLVGCGESVHELPPRSQAENPKETITPKVNGAESTLESQLVYYLKSGKKCIAVTQFGIYESVAILNLTPQPKVSGINNIPIKGSYYYVKHAKKIDLEGYLKAEIPRVVLNESYQGKDTGHIQFSGDDSAENYWQHAESTEKDKANLIHLYSIDSGIEAENIVRMYFENTFKVRDYSLPENSPLFEAKDSVWACKLPDNSLAFHINVTGDNFHLGSWKGIALPSDSNNVFIHKSFSHGSKCEFKIELAEVKMITFKDVDCDVCCGVRASLSGEYKYKHEIKLFTGLVR